MLQVVAAAGLLVTSSDLPGQPAPAPPPEVRLVQAQGQVEVMPSPATVWVLTQTNHVVRPFDRIRTGTRSRAALLWSDRSLVPMDALTELEILPPHATRAQPGIHLIKGVLSFFHRSQPGSLRVITRGAVAGIEGTEFVVSVEGAGQQEKTSIAVIDGKVTFSNDLGTLTLTNGQQAAAVVGQAPVLVAGFIAENLLQWAVYYPAVLDLKDLSLTAAEQELLAPSMTAYRQGDLLAALAKLPPDRQPQSNAERLYYAALLLGVGQTREAQTHLESLANSNPTAYDLRLAAALRLIVSVANGPTRNIPKNQPTQPTSTELLAASYLEQSGAVLDESLRNALELARQSVAVSPEFGFGWARVAELEFSFGRKAQALAALETALSLSPRNAQALALKGFVLASQNHTRAALTWFNEAIAVDSALGNAWLGRGLVRIRRGDNEGGREDLLIAAALEPKRSILRSYLSKAWSDAGDLERARKELDLARTLDPGDPTPWLYSALIYEQENRLNQAIRDLEQSKELNDNQRVYQSRLLLDQDEAVKRVNLARLYRDIGLEDVAIREAGRAVVADPTSHGAHFFLANAYHEARSAGPFGQRNETPVLSEFLVSSLLGPADGRLLLDPAGRPDYVSLFAEDGLGFSSSTEYLSRGAWNQYAAIHGTFGNSGFAVEGRYLSDPGQEANADLEVYDLTVRMKQMITPQDSVFVDFSLNRREGGDLAQRYYADARPDVRFEEEQAPKAIVGYHREWSPNSHTLLLGSFIQDDFEALHSRGLMWLLATDAGDPDFAVPTDLTRNFQREFITSAVELQQLFITGTHNVTLGARLHYNSENVANRDAAFSGNLSQGDYYAYFSSLPFYYPQETIDVDTGRATAYIYDYFEIHPSWTLMGGLTADYLSYSRNSISPPLDDSDEQTSRLSPHVGLMWEPNSRVLVKAGYSQSLGGVDFDQSIRLEPTHFAGTPTTFRSVFPDSLVGGVSAERMTMYYADSRLRFGENTYATIGLHHLEAKANRGVGAYTGELGGDPVPTQAGEDLEFDEQRLQFSLRQLISNYASLGTTYEVSRANLDQHLSGIDPGFCDDGDCEGQSRGTLHSLSLQGLGYHPSGLFVGLEAVWRLQTSLEDSDITGDTEPGNDLPDEHFWQINAYIGYRSPNRRVECTIGLLNITDEDYRLHPVNVYLDPPRERTLALQARFRF